MSSSSEYGSDELSELFNNPPQYSRLSQHLSHTPRRTPRLNTPSDDDVPSTRTSLSKEGFVVPGHNTGNAGKEEKAMVIDTAEKSLADRISHPKSWANKVTKSGSTDRPTCNFCHKVGHKQPDC